MIGAVLVYLAGSVIGCLIWLLFTPDPDAIAAAARSGTAGEVEPDHLHPNK